MREKLAPLLGEDVWCVARVQQFVESELGRTMLVLSDLHVNGQHISDHIWLRDVPAHLKEKYRVGCIVSFVARVKWYERLNTRNIEYGLEQPHHFRKVEVGT